MSFHPGAATEVEACRETAPESDITLYGERSVVTRQQTGGRAAQGSQVRGGGSARGHWSRCPEQHVVAGLGAHASSAPPLPALARHCTR